MSFSERMAWEVRPGASDGNSGGFRGGWSITPPAAPTLSNAGGSGISAGTYYFVLTYLQIGNYTSSGNGGKGTLESPHGPEASITLGSSANIQVNSPANPFAKGDTAYAVYVGTTSGGPYHPVDSNGVANPLSANCGTNLVMSHMFNPVANDFGPPGTDYTQQSGVHLTYTDLVIDGSDATKFTSVAHPGTPDLVGNTLNVTSGTGFTVQRIEMLNIDGSGAYYADKNVGSTGSTGGHAVLGGALATPGLAGAQLETAVDSGVVFIQAGTYTLSGTVNTAGGPVRSDSNNAHFIGYNTNRFTYNQDATRPTLQAGADSVTLLTLGRNYDVAANLVFAGNGHASVTGVNSTDRNTLVRDCESSACATGFTTNSAGQVYLRCFGNGDSGASFNPGGGGGWCIACAASVSGSANGFLLEGNCACLHCVAYGAGSGQGFNSDAGGNLFFSCTAYDLAVGFATNNGGTGIASTFMNCVAENCTTGTSFGISLPSDLMQNCAGFGNTADLSQVWGALIQGGFVNPGADPFNNAAGQDFGLNNVSNGGRLLRGAGVPGHAAATQIPSLVADSYVDVGAVQTSSLVTGMLVHPGYGGGMKS